MTSNKEKIYYILKEIVLTFSNKKSLFSSKRIERFVIFTSMLLMTVLFLLWRVFNCDNFGSSDLMLIVVGWLSYAGFNVIQGNKNIKKDEIINKTDTNITDNTVR